MHFSGGSFTMSSCMQNMLCHAGRQTGFAEASELIKILHGVDITVKKSKGLVFITGSIPTLHSHCKRKESANVMLPGQKQNPTIS